MSADPSSGREGVSPRRSRLRAAGVAAALVAGAVIVLAVLSSRGEAVDPAFTVTVTRGTLTMRLNETGTLRAAESITYRSPLVGRESEILFLAPEGLAVNEGDLIARLDVTPLEQDLERARQAYRQAEADARLADVEREEAVAALESLLEGAKALEVEETRTNTRLAERRIERLRAEYEGLKPLLDKGYITREELERSAAGLEEAEAETSLARRKAQLLVERTHPQEVRRARLQVAQREADVLRRRQLVNESEQLVATLAAAIQACSLYARRPGLVVYEDFLASSPRRKVRVGDRVTVSQGLVTIPEVSRMLIDTSVREIDVHRIKVGQPVVVRVDAYPDLKLSGKVAAVGSVARSSIERPFEEKRFDAIVEITTPDAGLRPEMTARLDIVVLERPDVLLVPVSSVFTRDGRSHVRVTRGWRTETRIVELGQASDFDVEVVSGLREGERLSLLAQDGAAPGAAPASPGLQPSPAAKP